jgi:hypothetical protein
LKILCIFLAFFVLFLTSSPTFPASVDPKVEWQIQTQLALPDTPLDVIPSGDGEWLFILFPGQVQIFSRTSGRVFAVIPVEGDFDKLTHSSRDNTLILASSSEKKVNIIQLQAVYAIDVSEHPFKGPENAPVTLAVFSDYQ